MSSNNMNPVCEEILGQLQRSLCRCVSNTRMHEYKNLKEVLNVSECTNIDYYKKSLHATKTQVTIKPSIIKPDTKYVMKYNVHERSVVMEEFCTYFPVV
jgi:hypothetical protein